MRKLVLMAVCLAGGAVAQTAPAPIGSWVFTATNLGGRWLCSVRSKSNNEGWQISVSANGANLLLDHPSMRISTRDVGEVGFLVAGRERLSLQFVGSSTGPNSFAVSNPQRMEQILANSRRVTVEIPRFGPQDFDVSGFAQARQVFLGCVNG